ncbi:virB8 family protein [Sphingomonas sanguinis]|uniref:virB8 family protein n=1 Tax=Sphingomonas sanguinis TaxID=33051 RepID=UPI0007373775|nr:VirB8/TrbF family protein [Sphingomonas sanguinis]
MKKDYHAQAESWALDTQVQAARSRRTAWTVAGIAVAAALFEAVALAMLAPLKTVEPITLLVDRQTGYVQALNPQQPQRIMADDALTQSLLAQYVTAREGFDRATVKLDYRKVALWSAGAARSHYLALMPATNPNSPLVRYPAGTVIATRVKSVSRIGQNLALVRFDTQRVDREGQIGAAATWVAVIRYRFVDAPMSLADRLINPLGFQVTGYRRDAEAVPPTEVPEPRAVAPVSPPAPVASMVVPDQAAAPRSVPTPRRTAESRSYQTGMVRAVPINQLPMGSPLSPRADAPVVTAAQP